MEPKELVKKLWEQKLVRFFFVGSFNAVMDITLLLIFYKGIGLPQLVANTFSVAITVTMSYFLNHKIVFRYRQGYSLKNYLRFFAVTGFSVIFIQDLIIYLVTDKLWIIASTRTVAVGSHHLFAKTLELLAAKVAGILLGMIWNYLLYKYVVFRHQPVDEAEEFTVA
jgi:putative flippase GtrA